MTWRKKGFGVVAVDEADGLLGEHVREIAAVGLAEAAVIVEAPLPVVAPAAAEAYGLVEAAGAGMVARVERAEVPLADEAGCVAGGLEHIGERDLAQGEAVEASALEGVDCAGAVRIPAGHQPGPGWGADGRGGVVLGQAEAVGGQPVQVGGLDGGVAEGADVAVTHIVSKYE